MNSVVSWLVISRSSKISLLKTSIMSDKTLLLLSNVRSFNERPSSLPILIKRGTVIVLLPLSIKFK